MVAHQISVLILFHILIGVVISLDNGLARTPPMGWLAWERFRCVTDCEKFPNDCIGEKLFVDMADRLSADGWSDVGYNYVNIDDCWMAKNRSASGELYADPTRFPNGIKKLADYIHSKGLKLGIYEDYGKLTCGGYPGSQGHEKTDANTFAKWGVDSLKFDGCYSNDSSRAEGYPLMSKALNETGRPIMFGCSWPAYDGGLPPKVNYTELGLICNLWRNYGDVQDSWDDVVSIIEWYATHQDVLIPAAGPGGWNDPDMIIAGDYALSVEQSKSQFGMWAMLAAPLFISNDLRNIDPEIVTVLQNREIIAVDQDKLGIPGRRHSKVNSIQTWSKKLSDGNYAVAAFSTRTDGTPYEHSFSLQSLGITGASSYSLYDLYEHRSIGKFLNKDMISIYVPPSGIRIFRAIPLEFEFLQEMDIEIDLEL